MTIILDKPNFPPYVCVQCGMSQDRKWFVSLALPLDHYFNPVNEGNIFFCNSCWESLATSVAKEAQRFLIGQDPWEGVKPTYENKTNLVEGVEFGTRKAHLSLAVDDRPAEPSDTVSEHNDPEPESTDTDAETEPLREFRIFFDGGDGSSGSGGPDQLSGGSSMSDESPETEEAEAPEEGEESGDEGSE